MHCMLCVCACEKFLIFPINIKAVSPDWLDHYQDTPFSSPQRSPRSLIILLNGVFFFFHKYNKSI